VRASAREREYVLVYVYRDDEAHGMREVILHQEPSGSGIAFIFPHDMNDLFLRDARTLIEGRCIAHDKKMRVTDACHRHEVHAVGTCRQAHVT
jgi:hypothetical protein